MVHGIISCSTSMEIVIKSNRFRLNILFARKTYSPSFKTSTIYVPIFLTSFIQLKFARSLPMTFHEALQTLFTLKKSQIACLEFALRGKKSRLKSMWLFIRYITEFYANTSPFHTLVRSFRLTPHGTSKNFSLEHQLTKPGF